MNFQDRIKAVARETLDAFAKVADAAKNSARKSRMSRENTLVPGNQWTTDPKSDPKKHVEQISEQQAKEYKALFQKPFIAHVVVRDEEGIEKKYYISRAGGAPPGLNTEEIPLASYRSPVGKLAARAVGDECTWQHDGKIVEILEIAKYRPVYDGKEWDSHGETIEGVDYGLWSFDSLRALIDLAPDVPSTPGDEDHDPALLDKILNKALEEAVVREGIRRSVINKMNLRDQPILDRYQDEIFRLPLNSRLLILGAPGTGKTTTLIRRLGQKLDARFLSADEQISIGENALDWIMFTPTDLLKFYVKEAFNLENIPASDKHIFTWDDFRAHLAREKFGILRTSNSKSSYVMKKYAHTLLAEAETDSIEWFTDFDQSQKSVFWEDMRAAANNLIENSAPEVARIGAKICEILGPSDTAVQQTALVSLIAMDGAVQAPVKSMKDETDKKIRGALNRQVNQNREFLNELAKFVTELAEADDSDDQDIEEEDSDESGQPRIGLRAAAADYMRAVRSQAGARARGRKISTDSRVGRIIEWLGDRSLPEQELLDVGKSLVVQSELRRFVNPARRYINGMPGRYRRFRRIRRSENRWYCAEGFTRAEVHPLEVDVILLAMMRSSNDLIRNARTISDDNPAHKLIERMQGLHHTQVLVDEATDFSPLQLAAMAALAHPLARSFFACGDFNQRMTSWGARSAEEMKWAVPDIDVRGISVAYRQSQQLHDLARKIATISGSGIEDVILPGYVDNQGEPPVLALQLDGGEEIAKWLSLRIQEIERFVGDLPSIAVLVNSEEEVLHIEKMLNEMLADQNIRVIACPNGLVPPVQSSSVFVLNVQHIKGLEFEAVFFIGVDKLEENQPDLFDKYLYVGATRAAAYFGMTCAGSKLPQKMAGLRELFNEGWQG